MLVKVSARIYPSEDPDKVRQAILNIFPSAVLETSENKVEGTADTVHFCKQIRRQKILDSTRSVMIKGSRNMNGVTTFYINKQVAFAGTISFTEEKTILGSIRVTIEDDDITALIDTIAPVTVDGEEVRI